MGLNTNELIRAVALSVFALAIAPTLAAEPADWRQLLSVRANSLSTCAIPASLETRRIAQLPKERLIAVYSNAITTVKDGCGVTVYTSEDKQRIYISIAGGLANHISVHLGPFRHDGNDF